MAIYYVWSGATGTANGSSWANAYTTFSSGVGGKAGDTVYVAHDHSELSAAINATPGLIGNPCKTVCVNRAGTVPPVPADRRATAVVATSANNAISLGGYQHIDGIIFIAGNSTGIANITLCNSSGYYLRLDNCSLRLGSTGNGQIILGAGSNGGNFVELNNTTASFAAVGQSIATGGCLSRWRNTPSALIGAQVPTILFTLPNFSGSKLECAGVDLSAAGSGKTLVGTSGLTMGNVLQFLDCKLNASVTKSVVPSSPGSDEVDFVRSGATGNYNVFRHRWQGTLEQETTIIRTGGASDGTTGISWKVITTASCNFSLPFECPPIAIWNDTIGSSRTATIEGIAAALPTDAEVWVDCEFLGDGSSPQGSFVNDGKADLIVTAANQTSSTEIWGGSTAAFKLAVTFTAQQKGWIYARVRVGKPSSTIYIDPLITLT